MSNPKNNTDSIKFHGEPCPQCGETLRYRKHNHCVNCQSIRKRKWYQKNKEYARKESSEWSKKNRDKASENQRRWRKENPDRHHIQQKKYRKKHVVELKKRGARYRRLNYDKTQERHRKYRDENREKGNARSRRYYAEHKELHKSRTRRWAENNPEKASEIARQYRMRKRNVISEPYNFKNVCKHYGNKCLCCGRADVKLTIDHIIPISKGGDDIANNVQPLCQSCNSSKATKSTDYRPGKGPLRWIQKKLFG